MRTIAAALLALGGGALALWPLGWAHRATSWEALLAPYSEGAPLPDGFRVQAIRRGATNEVVLAVGRPGEPPGVEVHLLPRGCWPGVRESRSFGIGYETPRSPAAQREAITEAVAETIRSRDEGLPAPDAIPLGSTFDGTRLARLLQRWRGVLVGTSIAALAAVALTRSVPLAFVGSLIGAADAFAWARGLGLSHGPCPIGGAADLIDTGVRAIQAAWVVLALAAPILCWRAGRAAGIGGARLVAAAAICAALALVAVHRRPDEPLHANGHAWADAREVLAPFDGRSSSPDVVLHARGAMSLQWLLASVERAVTGTVDPFRISRIGAAAAAGATALLTALLARSAWAGLASGCVLALMPLSRTLAVSGAALAVPASLLPLSLGLLIAAAAARDRALLAGAALAASLGTLSHTAMLAWAPALAVAWPVVAPRGFRRTRAVFVAGVPVAVAWVIQAAYCYEEISGRSAAVSGGLPGSALRGLAGGNLLVNPQWVSPALVPLAILGAVQGLRHARFAATVVALTVVAVPFFAVTTCSSDAVRYQAPLLGIVTSIATAGIWRAAFLGPVVAGALRMFLLGALIVLPTAARRPPTDPAVVEHRLVEDAARRMEPHTLVVLPRGETRVIFEFPEFLLPAGARVAVAGDPEIAAHEGPRLAYLGLGCISWAGDEAATDPPGMRPECLALRDGARPWLVRSLGPSDLPHTADGRPWTFHRLATDVPFGFFSRDGH